MKIRAIALNTFASLVRNKAIIIFCAVFLCVLLLMMTPMMAVKSMAATQSVEQGQAMVLGVVSLVMGMVTGFGSLLAAWSAADAIGSEMKSGTILAVMARPVRRWEFLLGKFLGVQLLMALYVVLMFGLSYLLAWMGGQRIQSMPWALVVYPMVRYAIYSALAMLLVTRMHPVIAFVIVLLASVLAGMVTPGGSSILPGWLRAGLHIVLPSTNLLSESNFLTITQASIKQIPWTNHLIALAHGLDYALVCFLLAAWSFRDRSLSRD